MKERASAKQYIAYGLGIVGSLSCLFSTLDTNLVQYPDVQSIYTRQNDLGDRIKQVVASTDLSEVDQLKFELEQIKSSATMTKAYIYRNGLMQTFGAIFILPGLLQLNADRKSFLKNIS